MNDLTRMLAPTIDRISLRVTRDAAGWHATATIWSPYDVLARRHVTRPTCNDLASALVAMRLVPRHIASVQDVLYNTAKHDGRTVGWQIANQSAYQRGLASMLAAHSNDATADGPAITPRCRIIPDTERVAV